jgi:uncharacterized protein (DUF433 family)
MDMDERALLERITANPEIYGGKAIIRGHRMAVEHVLQLMGAGSSVDELLEHYPGWIARTFRRACSTPPELWAANASISLFTQSEAAVRFVYVRRGCA